MSSIHWCFACFRKRSGAGCRAGVPVFTGVSLCCESGAGDPAGGGASRIFTTQLRGDADDPAVWDKRPATTPCRFRMLPQVLRCSFPENAVHHVL